MLLKLNILLLYIIAVYSIAGCKKESPCGGEGDPITTTVWNADMDITFYDTVQNKEYYDDTMGMYGLHMLLTLNDSIKVPIYDTVRYKEYPYRIYSCFQVVSTTKKYCTGFHISDFLFPGFKIYGVPNFSALTFYQYIFKPIKGSNDTLNVEFSRFEPPHDKDCADDRFEKLNIYHKRKLVFTYSYNHTNEYPKLQLIIPKQR